MLCCSRRQAMRVRLYFGGGETSSAASRCARAQIVDSGQGVGVCCWSRLAACVSLLLLLLDLARCNVAALCVCVLPCLSAGAVLFGFSPIACSLGQEEARNKRALSL